MKILVTGGAGYIGSHTIIELIKEGHDVVVVDNLSNSSKESIRRVEKITNSKVPFYQIDLRDTKALEKVFIDHKIDGVIHFAGLKVVNESINLPIKYYDNNIISTLVLLEVMQKFGVKTIVFSSSAAIYGTPSELPLLETSTVGHGITNPYGQSKFMIERILTDCYAADHDMKISILRYFNPVGAHSSGMIGEDPSGIPSNLLPYISQVAIGRLEKLNIYGDDYKTTDGTGVRDYIHVVDLAKGHVAAINNIKQGVSVYNLGTGRGVSVLDLVKTFSKVSGKDIPYGIVSRRPGDVAISFASADKAYKELDWKAEKTVEDMCRDAWHWQSKNPDGYSS